MIWAFFGYLLLFLLGLYFFLFMTASKLEPKMLFHPSPADPYINLGGTTYRLDSGGAVLHYTGRGHQAIFRTGPSRKIIFLHGNTGHLGWYESVYEMLFQAGYDVYAVEYVGFGICSQFPTTIEGVIANVREAWTRFGDAQAILMGFSIGGILMGQWYEYLKEPGPPAQLVFLNTFGSLPQLVTDVTHEQVMDLLGPALITRSWITQPPIDYQGRVLIVGTEDDSLISIRHSEDLVKTFASLRPTFVRVPTGGHAVGPFLHFVRWQPDLLSPWI